MNAAERLTARDAQLAAKDARIAELEQRVAEATNLAGGALLHPHPSAVRRARLAARVELAGRRSHQ
jgi:hypothetical protein